MKRVGGVGAEFPGRVQAVKFAPLFDFHAVKSAHLVDCSGGVGVVVSEALVDVAVEGDGPLLCGPCAKEQVCGAGHYKRPAHNQGNVFLELSST